MNLNEAIQLLNNNGYNLIKEDTDDWDEADLPATLSDEERSAWVNKHNNSSSLKNKIIKAYKFNKKTIYRNGDDSFGKLCKEAKSLGKWSPETFLKSCILSVGHGYIPKEDTHEAWIKTILTNKDFGWALEDLVSGVIQQQVELRQFKRSKRLQELFWANAERVFNLVDSFIKSKTVMYRKLSLPYGKGLADINRVFPGRSWTWDFDSARIWDEYGFTTGNPNKFILKATVDQSNINWEATGVLLGAMRPSSLSRSFMENSMDRFDNEENEIVAKHEEKIIIDDIYDCETKEWLGRN